MRGLSTTALHIYSQGSSKRPEQCAGCTLHTQTASHLYECQFRVAARLHPRFRTGVPYRGSVRNSAMRSTSHALRNHHTSNTHSTKRPPAAPTLCLTATPLHLPLQHLPISLNRSPYLLHVTICRPPAEAAAAASANAVKLGSTGRFSGPSSFQLTARRS